MDESLSPNKRVGAFMAQVRERRVSTATSPDEKARYSQEAVANRLGCTQSWLGNIEVGERRISVVHFLSWAEDMELSADEWVAFRECGAFTDQELEDERRQLEEQKRRRAESPAA